MCININLANNNIKAIGIEQLVPMKFPKLQYLNLRIIYINTDYNSIGSVGAKWLTKINMPLL